MYFNSVVIINFFQCISYVDPPIVPKLDQPRPGMPIIQSVTSMSTANNNVRNRLIHHNPLRAMPLFICESKFYYFFMLCFC